ncbi:hypothetical protein F5J12DRAFT_781283 [Pisolithus orientalis]|uniref:uncharacterized protein n=1 Tax=Pisolithus orientalis TaxID=936130 RepID=UPI0022245FD2|nr:uncharacterized protein F5J12DRAFT_781283 [Pisolithus orientalis]KAI6015269.1 hypothetical protein F5J12DRAFT_781283 [Pisolithus orientalis]
MADQSSGHHLVHFLSQSSKISWVPNLRFYVYINIVAMGSIYVPNFSALYMQVRITKRSECIWTSALLTNTATKIVIHVFKDCGKYGRNINPEHSPPSHAKHFNFDVRAGQSHKTRI